MDEFRTAIRRRVPAVAVLGLLALLAAALVFSSPPVHGQPTQLSVSFPGGTTIPDRAYTAGAAVPSVEHPVDTPEWAGLRLPEVAVTAPESVYTYEVDYSATGLPAGLSMAHDRIIRGTPGAATASPATVTYTATVTTYTRDGNTGVVSVGTTQTASLTFKVTVNSPVTFGAEATAFFNSRIITFHGGRWRDSDADGRITFPTASGGTGTLTYHLLDNESGQPLADVASGITFDTAARKLGGRPSEAKQWAVTFIAEDENGSRAAGHTTVYAGGYGGL